MYIVTVFVSEPFYELFLETFYKRKKKNIPFRSVFIFPMKIVLKFF